jgi:putative spermidine/putrescine transport system ATP-binding protein
MREFKRIVIKELTKEFGHKAALSDLSLEVARGEFVTFLGPSGCGKSTALNCIAGLLPITRGGIFIDEECIDDGTRKVPPEKREFGMVFQNYALFPHLTVFQNVAFGLHLRHIPKAEVQERVLAALTLVHLEGYRDKFPTQMSGGEQQRVAIARCIVLQPRLLMLDEPLSNLDAKLRIEMRYEILALHTRLGVTTIYVTHDQQEALALSDRICVLRAGRIQQVGTPVEVYSDPANLFVADFMGFKNLWSARITSLQETDDAVSATVDVGGAVLSARCRYGPTDSRRANLLAAFKAGAPVRTAIRPEEVQISANGGGNAGRARVALVEYQGQTSHVTAQMSTGATVELRPAATVRIGDDISLSIAPERVFLFPENGGQP